MSYRFPSIKRQKKIHSIFIFQKETKLSKENEKKNDIPYNTAVSNTHALNVKSSTETLQLFCFVSSLPLPSATVWLLENLHFQLQPRLCVQERKTMIQYSGCCCCAVFLRNQLVGERVCETKRNMGEDHSHFSVLALALRNPGDLQVPTSGTYLCFSRNILFLSVKELTLSSKCSNNLLSSLQVGKENIFSMKQQCDSEILLIA